MIIYLYHLNVKKVVEDEAIYYFPTNKIY